MATLLKVGLVCGLFWFQLWFLWLVSGLVRGKGVDLGREAVSLPDGSEVEEPPTS